MKRYIVIQILFTFVFISTGYAQWQWAKQIGGPSPDGGWMNADSNNNVYCVGTFSSFCYFDTDTFIANGANDYFLAKYDPTGNEIWQKQFGSTNPTGFNEVMGKLIIDDNNNSMYLSGTFYNILTIDGITVSGFGLDIFLAKFDLSGNCLWIKKAGSNASDDNFGAINIDNTGNVYWTGQLINNGTVDTFAITKGTFLAKVESNGNVLWARNEMADIDCGWLKIVNNEILFSGTTRNDTVRIDTMTLYCNTDAFLAKTDISGNVIWGFTMGGPASDYGTSFDCDANNNIYFTGRFEDSLFVAGDTLTNNGNPDLFISCFDNNGSLLWINQSHATGTGGALAYFITKDNDGKFYIVGEFGGNAIFGSYNITSNTPSDFFLARYNVLGDCIGIQHFGKAASSGVHVCTNGEVLVSGGFLNTVNIGSTSLTSYGNYDFFFAKSDAITGIGEGKYTENNVLLIYANPNTGKCNITVPDDFLHEKNLTLNIFDNSGKLIQQKTSELNDRIIKLNLEAEAKGTYNAVLYNSKKSYSGKIIFE